MLWFSGDQTLKLHNINGDILPSDVIFEGDQKVNKILIKSLTLFDLETSDCSNLETASYSDFPNPLDYPFNKASFSMKISLM